MARLAAALVCVAVSVWTTSAQQTVAFDARQMLDLYERDRPAAIAALGDHLHLDSVWDEIKSYGDWWTAADGPAAASRRRLVLATFLLEVVDRQDRSEWSRYPPIPMANRLIEWMNNDLAAHGKPLAAERLWRLGVIAVFEHRGDARFVERALNRADDRFAGEPAWILVRASLEDRMRRPPGTGPCMRAINSDHVWETCDTMFFGDSASLYRRAMALPSVAAEARIEFALLHLRRTHWDDVIALTSEIDQLTRDPSQRYRAALLRAWAFEAKADHPSAVAALRAALDAVPGGQTAAVQLASWLLLDGEREESAALMTGALASGADDPWLSHRDGEYGQWPHLIAALRRELR